MNNFAYRIIVAYMALTALIVSLAHSCGNGFNNVQIFLILNLAFAGCIYLGWSARNCKKPRRYKIKRGRFQTVHYKFNARV